MLRHEFMWIVSALVSECFSSHLLPAADRAELYESSGTSATFRSVRKRSLNEDERHFVLRTSGQERLLRLKRSEIFHPDFKAYFTQRSEDGKIQVMEHQNFNKRDVGTIYSVRDESGSLLIPDEDESLIKQYTLSVIDIPARDGAVRNPEANFSEGIVDETLRVEPLLVTGGRAPNRNTHTLYKTKIPVATKNDYLYAPPRRPFLKNYRVRERLDQGRPPPTITVELLILFDNLNSQRLDYDIHRIARYVGIFWNSIQSRYGNTSNPNIKFAISGIMTFNSPLDEPFLEAHKFNSTHVNDSILPFIKDWLMHQRNLPNYDAAIMHLGRDAGKIQNGDWKDSVAGLGYIGTACRTDEGYSLGFAEDQAPIFSGVITAAHELGHVLNCPHDGTGEAKQCPGTNGNIMNAVEGANRNWQFSACSLRILQAFVSAPTSSCLWNSPVSQFPIINEYPASMAGTLDEQCKLRYKDASFVFRGAVTPNICKYLWCSKTDSKSMVAHGGAVEGTMCDIRKICIAGECTSNNIPTLDQQCKDRFDGSFVAVNKYTPGVCEHLKCRTGTVLRDFGPARNGSMCGRAGICRDGNCIGQIFPLEQQCLRNFGENFRYYAADSVDICNTLWCTQDGSNLKSFGPAAEYSECATGRLCQQKTCVAVEY